MSSHTSTRTIRKQPPNLSFPPQYPSSPQFQPTSEPPIYHSSTIQRTSPATNFPLHKPAPSPTPIAHSISNVTATMESNPQMQASTTFLTIPLEIRLIIYNYVLLAHPVQHPHVVPPSVSRNDQEQKQPFCKTMLRPLGLSFPNSSSHALVSNSNSHSLRPPHTMGKIPTALLLACTQTYTECASLPFQSNTFKFTNWFHSGVYSARQFTRSLRTWQSKEIRNVELEVRGRDLLVDGMRGIGGGVGGQCEGLFVGMAGEDCRRSGEGEKRTNVDSEWQSLCSLWTGVRRLKLVLKGPLTRAPSASISVSSLGKEEEESSVDRQGAGDLDLDPRKETLLDIHQNWTLNGLLRLKSLSYLELAIEDEGVFREEKLDFCGELEMSFARARGTRENQVRVVLIEKVEEVEGNSRDGQMNLGEGGEVEEEARG